MSRAIAFPGGFFFFFFAGCMLLLQGGGPKPDFAVCKTTVSVGGGGA